MIEFTAEQKRQAVERELKFRMRVYARRVVDGTMTKEKSEYELGVMRAILLDYEGSAAKERLI